MKAIRQCTVDARTPGFYQHALSTERPFFASTARTVEQSEYTIIPLAVSAKDAVEPRSQSDLDCGTARKADSQSTEFIEEDEPAETAAIQPGNSMLLPPHIEEFLKHDESYINGGFQAIQGRPTSPTTLRRLENPQNPGDFKDRSEIHERLCAITLKTNQQTYRFAVFQPNNPEKNGEFTLPNLIPNQAEKRLEKFTSTNPRAKPAELSHAAMLVSKDNQPHEKESQKRYFNGLSANVIVEHFDFNRRNAVTYEMSHQLGRAVGGEGAKSFQAWPAPKPFNTAHSVIAEDPFYKVIKEHDLNLTVESDAIFKLDSNGQAIPVVGSETVTWSDSVNNKVAIQLYADCPTPSKSLIPFFTELAKGLFVDLDKENKPPVGQKRKNDSYRFFNTPPATVRKRKKESPTSRMRGLR